MKICSRHEGRPVRLVGQAEEPPYMPPQNVSVSAVIESVCESQALTRLSEEDRQFIVDKLAEILVLDYQANHTVPGPTGQKPLSQSP